MPDKPPLKFGQPEKTDVKKTILLWAIVVAGLAGIIYMIAVNPKQKALNCNSGSPTSLISIGSCTEE